MGPSESNQDSLYNYKIQKPQSVTHRQTEQSKVLMVVLLVAWL